MIKGIHHISLLITREKTLNFYKTLGFSEIYRKDRANDSVVLLEGYGVQLEVFIDSRHPVRMTDLNEPLGPRHFALKTDNIEAEIERLKTEMTEKANFVPEFEQVSNDWTGEKYVFFKDPDGNIVELHE